LLNRTVLRRAFGVLGPTEAVCSMTAFVLALVAGGWRPGEVFPEGTALYAASGAAFLSVVFAQGANAFACRSSSRWPGQLGWFTNRLLLGGVAFGTVLSLLVVLIEPIAAQLEQASPPLVGWIAALLSACLLLGVDALDKRRRRHRRLQPSR
jgi:magnesium-transporting ATPase (P-type)